jgi:glycosyltransferase involved in cell wall biosynthesis
LRIIRVSEYVTPAAGGKEVHVRELSWRQAEHGDSVHLLFRVGGEDHWPFQATHLLRETHFHRRIPHRLVSAVFLTLALARIVARRQRVDLVHFHGDYLEALAAGIVRAIGIPSVITLHGRLSDDVLRRAGFLYRFPSHVIVVSTAIASQLARHGFDPRNLTIQHSGVDRRIFYPSGRVPANSPFRVVVASALIPLKDHVTILEAVRQLRREGLDVRLEIAGDGPDHARLRHLAPAHTHFHGQLERAELGGLMRECHLSTLGSIDTPIAGEGTPTVLMEGLACGLPFVATDVGGVAELASKSKAGVVVPQKNVARVAAELRNMASSESLWADRRRAALAFAPQLDWDVVAERLSAVLRSVAANGRLRGSRSARLAPGENDVIGE